MRLVAVTQRVVTSPETGERRDALDQNWNRFLQKAGLAPLLIPNTLKNPKSFLEAYRASGILLTGGNDLVSLGGDAPERDELEKKLISHARENNMPILGICRGMQLIQQVFGVELHSVTGHVAQKQIVCANGKERLANSYHNFGSTKTVPSLRVWAHTPDEVVKAVQHNSENIHGLMWHPERLHPFHTEDIDFIQKLFDT